MNAVFPPLVAALRLPFTLIAGFVLVLFTDAAALVAADEVFPEYLTVNSFGDALLASITMAAVSIAIHVLAGTNDDDEYTLRVIRRVARRQGPEIPDGRAGNRLPRDRRARTADPACGHARRERAAPGPLGGRARLPAVGVGDRSLVADGYEPGRDPARLQRRHPGLSLGREGERAGHELLGPTGLRRDRAPGQSLVAYGTAIVLAAWLGGRTAVATAIRRTVAPYLRRPAVAYGVLAAALLLLFWWDPVVATSRLVPSLILIVIAAVGIEALRAR